MPKKIALPCSSLELIKRKAREYRKNHDKKRTWIYDLATWLLILDAEHPQPKFIEFPTSLAAAGPDGLKKTGSLFKFCLSHFDGENELMLSICLKTHNFKSNTSFCQALEEIGANKVEFFIDSVLTSISNLPWERWAEYDWRTSNKQGQLPTKTEIQVFRKNMENLGFTYDKRVVYDNDAIID